jgi:hypothetical protein
MLATCPVIPLRSSEVPWGVRVAEEPSLTAETDGALLCLLRYEAERGKLGRGPDWRDGRRLASGEADVEEAGDRCDGGV